MKDGLVDVEASERLLTVAADLDKEGVRQRHRRERAARDADRPSGGRGSSSGYDGDLRADPSDSAYKLLTKHRAAAEQERATLLRLEREREEGSLVDAEAVRKRELQLGRAGREAVMNMRYRIDPLLAGEVDAAKRGEIWDRETRAICDEIARAVVAPMENSARER